MATMTAADLVALVNERACRAFHDLPYMVRRGKRYFNIVPHTYNGTRHTAARTVVMTFIAESRDERAIMSAELTPQNIASVAALARALYESAALRLTKDDFISGLALLDAHADAAVDGLLDHLAASQRKDG